MFSKLFKKAKPQETITHDHAAQLYEIIRNILDEKDRNTPLTMDTVLEDIGFDSIKYIHLLLSLEDIVKGDLETVMAQIDLTSIRTIRDINHIVNQLAGK